MKPKLSDVLTPATAGLRDCGPRVRKSCTDVTQVVYNVATNDTIVVGHAEAEIRDGTRWTFGTREK